MKMSDPTDDAGGADVPALGSWLETTRFRVGIATRLSPVPESAVPQSAVSGSCPRPTLRDEHRRSHRRPRRFT